VANAGREIAKPQHRLPAFQPRRRSNRVNQ
jgi:hypothetical protein